MNRTVFKVILVSMLSVMVSLTAWAADKPPAGVGPGQMPSTHLMEVPENIQLDRDIVYATMDGHELKLDIAYPNDNKTKIPAIVYIHGGGWVLGDKDPNQAITYAKNGFVGIAIQYRLSGVAKFPAAVYDCKAAIRWVRANAKKYGINPDKIGRGPSFSPDRNLRRRSLS
jgi:acetyl esterase/lipase